MIEKHLCVNKLFFRFSEVGIKHFDLYFDDGTAPPIEILNSFLNIVENSNQAVAVHCRVSFHDHIGFRNIEMA